MELCLRQQKLVAIEAEEAASAKQETLVARTQVKESLAVCVDNWLANHNKLLIWHCNMYFLFPQCIFKGCWGYLRVCVVCELLLQKLKYPDNNLVPSR